MTNETTGYLTFYDMSTGIFNVPDPTKQLSDYEWPGEDPTDPTSDPDYMVKDWTTWMLALSYWLEYYFDIEVSSGDGSSLGQVGSRRYNSQALYSGRYRQYIERDNDWSSDDLGRYDPPLDDSWPNFQQYRCPSPFDYRASDSDPYTSATGKWQGTEKFDFIHNRFDIILKLKKDNNNLNNLGIRIKYPITTTGTADYVEQSDAWTVGCSSNSNAAFIVPGAVPIVIENNDIIQPIFNDYYMDTCGNDELTAGNKAFGYITFFSSTINSGSSEYFNDYVVNQYRIKYKGNIYDRHSLPTYGGGDRVTTFLKWNKDFEQYLNSGYKFSVKGRPYNHIYFRKSMDDKNINICILDQSYGKKFDFIVFENTDGSQTLLLGNDNKSFYNGRCRDNMYRYIDQEVSGVYYKNYDIANTYGTIGNTMISNKQENGQYLNKLTPSKAGYYYDVRDSNYNLIDATGNWRLELFSPFNNVYATNLFLVTRCGTQDLLSIDGKYIIATLNGDLTKFLVFTFNGRTLHEYSTNDNNTMFAIPIEVIE